MKIGIIIAIARELKAFLESSFSIEEINDGVKTVYHAKINNNDVYAVQSGWGEIDAAAETEYLISKWNCSLIINYGVTGALKSGLKVDDLFVVTKAVNFDYDVSSIDNVVKHQYEEFPDIFIPLDLEMIEFVKKMYPDIQEAICSTGDHFVDDPNNKKQMAECGCNICDMEVAAIARRCYLNNVKCLSIKCISDTLEGDGGDFEKNVVNSAAKAFALIKEILLTI